MTAVSVTYVSTIYDAVIIDVHVPKNIMKIRRVTCLIVFGNDGGYYNHSAQLVGKVETKVKMLLSCV